MFGKEVVLYYRFDNKKTFALTIRDINDLGIVFEIFVTQVYIFPDTLQNPTYILDIWWHVWFFTLLCHYLYPKAHIYTFEPDPANFEQLTKNLALNKVDTSYIHTHNFGVGKEEAQVQLYQTYRWSDKSLYPTDDKIGSCTIQIRPLSSILHEYDISYVDVLKIDIEWAEHELFDAWWFESLRNVYCFFLEVHPAPGYSMHTLIKNISSYFPIHRSQHIVHYFCKHR